MTRNQSSCPPGRYLTGCAIPLGNVRGQFPPDGPRRLLKYWSGPRCCRSWCWPRRERSVDIHSDLGPASNAGQGQDRRNPAGARQKGRLAASLARCSPAWDASRSLLAIHPFCLYARTIPVFQQSPRVPAIHFQVQVCSNGQIRSLSAIAATGKGHRMPSFGSSKRTPADSSGA